MNPNYLAIVVMDSPCVSILDIRQAGVPIVDMNLRSVNAIQWAYTTDF